MLLLGSAVACTSSQVEGARLKRMHAAVLGQMQE